MLRRGCRASPSMNSQPSSSASSSATVVFPVADTPMTTMCLRMRREPGHAPTQPRPAAIVGGTSAEGNAWPLSCRSASASSSSTATVWSTPSTASGDRWVVLVHGQLMPRRMHQPLARTIAGEGFHVVTVDLLGHGRSDRPLDPKEYSMTAFGEQVVALLDHLGAEQAVIGGTSLGANVSLEVADVAPDRVRGLLLEMPVLDNALEAGLIAFGPLMFLARFVPVSVSLTRRLLPAGAARASCRSGPGSRWTRCDQQPAPMAAAIHGIFFGRIAPSSQRRRQIQVPALVVGHPRDPIHPAADAAMLADEMPNARFVAARSIARVARPPGAPRRRGGRLRRRSAGRRRADPPRSCSRLTRAVPVPRRAGRRGTMGAWASTGTKRSCCAPRSWVRRTASSRCSPAARAGPCGRQGRTTDDLTLRVAARAVHPRRPAARRGPRRSTSSPRPRRSTRSRAGWAPTTSATPPAR